MKLYAFALPGERIDLTELLPDGIVALIIEHHGVDYRIKTGSDGISVSLDGQMIITPINSNIITVSEEI